MKTIIFLLLLLGISVCSHAQNQNFSPIQKNYFNENLQKDTSGHFAISPHFKSKTLPYDFKFSEKYPGNSLQFNPHDSILSSQKFSKYELRMPVVKPRFYSNMPIAVPDSSVHYYLRVKRIPIINPLTGK